MTNIDLKRILNLFERIISYVRTEPTAASVYKTSSETT